VPRVRKGLSRRGRSGKGDFGFPGEGGDRPAAVADPMIVGGDDASQRGPDAAPWAEPAFRDSPGWTGAAGLRGLWAATFGGMAPAMHQNCAEPAKGNALFAWSVALRTQG
jgi:hypothetical protein